MDTDTFITTVYVVVDDIYKQLFGGLRPPKRGRRPWLSDSEVLTLALLAQWHGMGSERAFLRFAGCQWQPFFPAFSQSAFNKRARALGGVLSQLAVAVSREVCRLSGTASAYEAIDSTVVPLMRRCRGERMKLFSGQEAAIGRVGSEHRWEYGVKLFAAVGESGCVSGFVAGPASTEDRWLAEAFLNWRKDPSSATPSPEDLAEEIGPAHRNSGRRLGPAGPLWPPQGAGEQEGKAYLADRGFRGEAWQRHWEQRYHAEVLTPQESPGLRLHRRELNSRRQVVETVFHFLCDTFHLKFPRARTLKGLQARLAAKIAALNVSILVNLMHRRSKFTVFNPIA
jgi:Transposase DDE domain